MADGNLLKPFKPLALRQSHVDELGVHPPCQARMPEATIPVGFLRRRLLSHGVNNLSDQQLLRAYAESQSEAAFAELVRRHVDFVYSAALRMVRDTHLAEDVCQSVFVALEQSAGRLADCVVLLGWLHRTTENLAANTVRSDVRRRTREQEAAVMNELLSANPDSNWEYIAPHLDAALRELDSSDREAVLLRYFKNHDLRTVGATLGISDDAAQKRVSRAVERLRDFFAKRGISIGAGGLAVVLSTNAVQAAPAGLAAILSATALAGATAAGSTALGLVLTHVFNLAKFKSSAAMLVLAALVAMLFLQHQTSQRVQTENRALWGQVAASQQLAEQADMARLAAMKASELAVARAEQELPRLKVEVARLRSRIGLALRQDELAANTEPKEPVLSIAQLKALLRTIEPVPPDVVDTRPFVLKGGRSDANALQALRAQGTNLLPQLLEILSTRDTNSVYTHVRGDPDPPFFKEGRFQRWLAIKGFYALGPEAAVAIPALLNFPMLGDNNRDDAAYALAGIGSVAITPLSEALSSPDNAIRRRAMLALGYIGPESSAASTALIRCVGDPQETPDLRFTAMFALERIAPDSVEALPVLLEAFRDPNLRKFGDVTYRFCRAFEHYGPRAKAAFPGLLEMLPNLKEREASDVRKALKAVDAQAAASAGIQ